MILEENGLLPLYSLPADFLRIISACTSSNSSGGIMAGWLSSTITAICTSRLNSRIPIKCFFKRVYAALCIVNICRMNVNTQEISHRICYNVPFSSLRFFPRHIHDFLHNTLFLRSVNRSVRNLVLHSFLLVFVLF